MSGYARCCIEIRRRTPRQSTWGRICACTFGTLRDGEPPDFPRRVGVGTALAVEAPFVDVDGERAVTGYPWHPVAREKAAEKELKPRTLTNLYNARPQLLPDAPTVLDAAVAAA